jgi:hypothetical protein
MYSYLEGDVFDMNSSGNEATLLQRSLPESTSCYNFVGAGHILVTCHLKIPDCLPVETFISSM